MQTTIKQYLRHTPETEGYHKDGSPFYGEPFGIMLASLRDGQLCFGWSLCHEMDKLKYDKKKGYMIAENRMKAFVPNSPLIVPSVMVDPMFDFTIRAEKQFSTLTDSQVIDGFELAIERRHNKKK